MEETTGGGKPTKWLPCGVVSATLTSTSSPVDSIEYGYESPVTRKTAFDMSVILPWKLLAPTVITEFAHVPDALPSAAVAATCVTLPLPFAAPP